MSQVSTWEGIPRATAFSSDAHKVDAIVRPAERALTLGAVITGALRQLENPALVVIDASAGTILATDNSNVKSALLACLQSPDASVELVPDAAQVGRSVQWHTENPASWGDYADAVTGPIVTAAKPSKTVETVVMDAVKHMNQSRGEPLFIVVDQSAGKVKLLRFAPGSVSGVSAALSTVEGAGVSLGVKLQEKTKPNFV